MPRNTTRAAIAALTFIVLSCWSGHAEPSWSGWSSVCPGGACASLAEACQSWVAYRQIGGFPQATLRRVQPDSSFDGAQISATCWIQRNPSSTPLFDLPDPTTATCPAGQSESFLDADGCVANPVVIKGTGQPDVALIGGEAPYTGAEDRWWVRAFGKNLSDEEYRIGELPVANLWVMSFYGEPRTYGLEAGMKFGW